MWPSSNGVEWLPDEEALRFKPPGIGYVEDLSFPNEGSLFDEFTLHLSVSPGELHFRGFRPMVVIHAGDDSQQLSVWHWGASLIAMNGDDYDYTRKFPRLIGENVLISGQKCFISITSGKGGTQIFVNGESVAEKKGLRLRIPDTLEKRHLVLGNSVSGDKGWDGDFHAFGIYTKAFSTQEVRDHFLAWSVDSSLPRLVVGGPQLLYTFSKLPESQVLDASGHGHPLLLPVKPIVLQKKYLIPPWQNVQFNTTFFQDCFLNFAGFIFLGAVLCFCLIQFGFCPIKYVPWLIVLFCFLLSLTMEITQASLPTRVSSLLDLGLNSVGAWVGVMLYLRISNALRA